MKLVNDMLYSEYEKFLQIKLTTFKPFKQKITKYNHTDFLVTFWTWIDAY